MLMEIGIGAMVAGVVMLTGAVLMGVVVGAMVERGCNGQPHACGLEKLGDAAHAV